MVELASSVGPPGSWDRLAGLCGRATRIAPTWATELHCLDCAMDASGVAGGTMTASLRHDAGVPACVRQWLDASLPGVDGARSVGCVKPPLSIRRARPF